MADQFPIPPPTVPLKPLTTFKSLSFDIYETLIVYASSINPSLEQLWKHAPADSPYKNTSTDKASRTMLEGIFTKHQIDLQAEFPGMIYDEVLEQAYLRSARDLGIKNDEVKAEAKAFGGSVGDWPAYPDTVDALKRLGKYYKLVPLSNVDRDSVARTISGPLSGVDFWQVYTAQDIGSYKPDLKNFEYLLKHIDEEGKKESGKGIGKDENLHVAQSLFHDHVPAKKMGMSSVWINRKAIGPSGPAEFKRMHDAGEVGYGWRFKNLGELADEVERQWSTI